MTLTINLDIHSKLKLEIL